MHAHTNMHMHTRTHTHTDICMHTHTPTHEHADTHTHTYIHLHTHTYTHARTHKHTHAHTHTHRCTRTHADRDVDTGTHTNAHAHIHTHCPCHCDCTHLARKVSQGCHVWGGNASVFLYHILMQYDRNAKSRSSGGSRALLHRCMAMAHCRRGLAPTDIRQLRAICHNRVAWLARPVRRPVRHFAVGAQAPTYLGRSSSLCAMSSRN